MAPYPWDEPRNQQYRNFNVGGSLWSEFVPIVLRTNHRQGESLEFARICEKIRLGGLQKLENSDIERLESRICRRTDQNIPENAVYIFARNQAVNEVNSEMTSKIEGPLYTALWAMTLKKVFENQIRQMCVALSFSIVARV